MHPEPCPPGFVRYWNCLLRESVSRQQQSALRSRITRHRLLRPAGRFSIYVHAARPEVVCPRDFLWFARKRALSPTDPADHLDLVFQAPPPDPPTPDRSYRTASAESV